MLNGKAANTNFIVFGLTWQGLDSTNYCTRGEHASWCGWYMLWQLVKNSCISKITSKTSKSQSNNFLIVSMRNGEIWNIWCKWLQQSSLNLWLIWFEEYNKVKNTCYWLNTATYFCLFSKPRPGFPTPYVVFNCSIVWGGCLFCWYWWNCWPYLFKSILVRRVWRYQRGNYNL